MKIRAFFYISNVLSITRIFLLIPIYYLLKLQTATGNYLTVLVMMGAVATDYLDGYLARKFKQRSDLGRVLDPLADKICVILLAMLLMKFRNMPIWYFLLVLTRDLAILLLGLFMSLKTKVVVESNKIGKVTVTGLALVLILFTLEIESVKWIFLWVSVGLIAISSISYLWRAVNFVKDTNT